MANKEGYYMVFDVESMGLHGPAFAVGLVILDAKTRKELACRKWWVNPDNLRATVQNRKWVEEHCPWAHDLGGLESPKELRDAFWKYWTFWKAHGWRRTCLGPSKRTSCPPASRTTPSSGNGTAPTR